MAVLLNLKDIRENPPSLNVSAASEILGSTNVQSSSNDKQNAGEDTNAAGDSIDWDISVDSAQIDWDIGTVEETEDAGNGLGPYEVINASEILQCSQETDQTPSNKVGYTMPPEVSASEISWDVSVETHQVDLIDDANLPNISVENQKSLPDTVTQMPGINEDRSQLLETEYRNKILDDLYEVYYNLSLYLSAHITAAYFSLPPFYVLFLSVNKKRSRQH